MIAIHLQLMFEVAWSWIRNATLAASILTVLLLIAQTAFRRFLSARWLYALWACVLLRLLMPIVPASPTSILNLLKLKGGGETPAPASPAMKAVTLDPIRVLPDTRSARTISAVIPAAGKKQTADSFPIIPGVVWLSGAFGYLGVVFLQHRRWSRWICRQPPLTDASIRTSLKEAHQIVGCTRAVELIATNSLTAPSLFGFWRPKLLLPTSLNLSAAELRMVLMHELTHVKRGDVLLNWLIILVQALHWFNPMIWLAMRQLRATRESWCDELVISRLQADERRLYGATLIKLIDSFSGVPSTLIPIVNRKKQMHQRIAMIAKFKPTTRLMSAVSAAMLLTIACLTFTRAAEKPAPAPPAASQAIVGTPARPEAARRRVEKLELLLREHDLAIARKQASLDDWKKKLGIELEEDSKEGTVLSSETRRKLQTLHLEAQADYYQIFTLWEHLSRLSRSELKKSILTASPDPTLSSLYEQLATAEQKLATLSDTFGPGHPEVKGSQRLLERITKQIDDRLDGILTGLKAKAAAYQARMENLQKQLESKREKDVENTITRRPYFNAKRELESLQQNRDRIESRLLEERINAALEN